MAQNPEAAVVFGVLNETSETESRVALTPDIVTRLKRSGVSSIIEAGAGIAAEYTDEDYEKAGAKVTSRDEVLAEADALGFVDRPSAETVAKLKAGQWVIGMLGSFTDADYVAALEKAGLVGIAIEKLPRKLSSAQSMDEMTSQNSVMGYKAAITAADAYGSFLPMMTTAAGTIRPAKALVLGAGIAGLQAIGTLKRLGAVVTAYDVRPASQSEVESLGAKFLDLGLDFSKGQGEGGYARALSAEEQAQQQAAVDEKAAGFDIIITTAKVPGRKPPVLLTAAGVKGLKRGAVIVDCAASDLGGNVGQQRSERCSRRDERRKITAVKPEGRQYFGRKLPFFRIKERAGGCHRVLARLVTGQKVSEQVGGEQHARRTCRRTVAAIGIKLIYGIEIKQLYSRDTVQLFVWHNALAELTYDPGGAAVAVMRGVGDEPAARIKKSVVNAPCIDTYRAQFPARSGGAYRILALRKKPEDIPCEASVHHLRLIWESVHLAQ